MMSSDEYRANAKEARLIALASSDPAVRAAWSQSVLDWLNMAALADGQVAMKLALLATRQVDQSSNENTPGPPEEGAGG
jgi:hypothetical protein